MPLFDLRSRSPKTPRALDALPWPKPYVVSTTSSDNAMLRGRRPAQIKVSFMERSIALSIVNAHSGVIWPVVLI